MNIRTALLLGASCFAPLAASAQSSSTPIIGFYKVDVPAGASALCNAFVAKKEFQGAAATMTPGSPNSTITVAGTPFDGLTFDLHYAEILSSPNAGYVIEILSNSSNSITVKGNVGPSGIGLDGTETFCVRRHATLASVLDGGAGLAANEDLVIILDETGAETLAIYTGTQWESPLNPGVGINDQIIYPNQGMVIVANNSRTLTFGGGDVSYVRTGPSRPVVYAGIPNFVGGTNPLVGTAGGDTVTLQQLGLQSLAPNEDFAITFSTDGALESQLNILFSGINLFDALNPDVNFDAQLFRNGQALVVIPNQDRVLNFPQTFPN